MKRVIEKILCATDFSSSSAEALEHALALRRLVGAEVCLLHACEIPSFVEPDAMVVQDADLRPLATVVHEQAETRMRDVLDALDAGERKGITARVVHGSAFETISRIADEESFDLIVIGTRGRSPRNEFVMGSVAEKVSRHAHCPVYVVRQGDSVSRLMSNSPP